MFSSQKLLDCLFSDIEAFVNQLQRAVEAFNNLKKRRTIRENGYGGESNDVNVSSSELMMIMMLITQMDW